MDHSAASVVQEEGYAARETLDTTCALGSLLVLRLSPAPQLPCAADPRPVRVRVPRGVFSLHFDIFTIFSRHLTFFPGLSPPW